MGSCISRQSTSSQPPLVPTMLVLPNGGLLQFSMPTMVSHVLGKDERTCFVCDSDTMEVDRVLTAIAGDKELILGQIYFVLPRSMLNRPLKGTEMAELAVRASGSLSDANFDRRSRRGVVAPLDFAAEEKEVKETKEASGKAFKYVPDLGAIAE